MELKTRLDRKTMLKLKKIADEQGREIDEVATEFFEKGMDIGLTNFFPFGVPPRAH